MDINWPAELLAQTDFYLDAMLGPRLEGLTDEEYLWEPVAGCWSVHPRGDGAAAIDWAYPPPVPAPVTTIAWRLCHLAGTAFAMRTNHHFGDGTWSPDRSDWPVTAAGGISYLTSSYAAWRTAVLDAGPERLAAPTGPAEGPYAETPFATLVLHLARELMHHGGEIGLLRDLYLRRST
jgi:hypothetical protein